MRVEGRGLFQIFSRVGHDDFHDISAAESVFTWELAMRSYRRRLCSSRLYDRLDSCVGAADVILDSCSIRRRKCMLFQRLVLVSEKKGGEAPSISGVALTVCTIVSVPHLFSWLKRFV